MIIFSWNCRGAASQSFTRTLKEYLIMHKPDLVILQETRCSGDTARRTIDRSGFAFSHVQDANGFSGGIWILWNDPNISVKVVRSCVQFIHMEVTHENNHSWMLTAIYASPQERNRRSLWSELRTIATGMSKAWLLVGGFNEIMCASEKKGGGRTDLHACAKFKKWIDDCCLIDLGYIGSKFTWKGPVWEGMERVFKRLDRALCNADWRTKFAEAKVDVLTRMRSDHHPLLVILNPQLASRYERPFRYEAMWITHPEYKETVRQNWNYEKSLDNTLIALSTNLSRWNKEAFGHVGRMKRRLINRIGGIQRAQANGKNPFLERLELQLHKELADILDREEILWLQKSREMWIIDGDRNTRYYHTRTIIRRRKNKILKLRNNEGTWVEDQEELANLAINFFTRLYQEQGDTIQLQSSKSYSKIQEDVKRNMDVMPTGEEIKDAFFRIGSLKAPGLDGFPAIFYKENWDVIGESIINHVKSCWEEPSNIKNHNKTLITLIPKVTRPEFITQFRPIALCNVSYKGLSKILVNRLKPALIDRIAPHQSSFVPGRKIQDNILIAKELSHVMRRMKGRKGYMAIKVDFEKAYDRLNWSFLNSCLVEFGVPEKLVSIIMISVTSVTYNVL
ncbi:hypothetical protein Ahy_B01g051758 [Arachis hypogaea]|uniref:Uncharacterized protein n=1 Tax=Arachis hypogaea TaxID=3818 RepID=A0A445AMP1_ARAHY|nr:hypothetical protein Ahy_B01g051758 [Arachis hypogaea]